ncbi:MAG: lipocalin-like domain-containing protein [Rhodospirillaceae bacterium]|nr:lipocalin-like domain-containing protein [Rhodospirillaceae bacterium]
MTLTSSDLIGAWTFVDWVITSPHGRVSRPFQPNPTGALIYSADGLMSAVIQAGHRPRFASDDVRKRPDAEKAGAFDGYFHYGGTWTVHGVQVVHRVAWALNPNMIGSEQVRDVKLEDGVLILSADESLDAGTGVRHHALTWRRHAPAALGARDRPA